jgi:hypothetical protein
MIRLSHESFLGHLGGSMLAVSQTGMGSVSTPAHGDRQRLLAGHGVLSGVVGGC